MDAVPLMEGLTVVMPVIASVIGTLIAILLGMALSKLNGISSQFETLNTQVYDHVTKPSVHEAGFARVEEQIANLLQTVKAAHNRIDRIEEHASG